MDDDFDDDDLPSGERQRAVLRRVAAYRDVCASVRKSGTHSLFFGALMLFLWYVAYYGKRDQFSLISVTYLSLGVLELFTGLLNRFRPTAEGILLDGLVLIGFGGMNLFRQYLIWNQGLAPNPILLLFAAFWLFQGFGHVREYAVLRKVFAERPSRAHLRWFDDLIAEIRTADPEADTQALDLPTRPRLRAKLLGDTAIFLTDDHETLFVDRRDVTIEREPSKESDRLPTGYLTIEGMDFGGFKLHPENWQNYATWKTEGGQPPLTRPAV